MTIVMLNDVAETTNDFIIDRAQIFQISDETTSVRRILRFKIHQGIEMFSANWETSLTHKRSKESVNDEPLSSHAINVSSSGAKDTISTDSYFFLDSLKSV